VIAFVDDPDVLVLQARVHGCFVLAIEADYATLRLTYPSQLLSRGVGGLQRGWLGSPNVA